MAETTSIDVRATLPERGIELDFHAGAGRVTAVVGPNGAGKSTLLDLIAGHLSPGTGSVRLGERTVAEGSHQLPAHQRQVGLLEQRPRLFPHLSVLDNVAFGPRNRGLATADARARARAELALVDAGELAAREPSSLSGGQAQRVALARVLAADPQVLLLDEPLAGVDVPQAPPLRLLLARRCRELGLTTVLVTHELADLWALADDLTVLDAGRVVAAGPVEDLLTQPSVGFLARLSGLNLVTGRAVAVDTLEVAGLPLVGAGEPLTPGAAAVATFAPEAVALAPQVQLGSARNQWPVTVLRLEPRGALTRVQVQPAGGPVLEVDLTARSAATLGLLPGSQVVAVVKAAQVHLATRPEHRR